MKQSKSKTPKSFDGAKPAPKPQKSDGQKEISTQQQVASQHADNVETQVDGTWKIKSMNKDKTKKESTDFMSLIRKALNEADDELGFDIDAEGDFGGDDDFEDAPAPDIKSLVSQLSDLVTQIQDAVGGDDDFSDDEFEDEEFGDEGDYEDDLSDIPEESADPAPNARFSDGPKKTQRTGARPNRNCGRPKVTSNVTTDHGVVRTAKKSKFAGETGKSNNKVTSNTKNKPNQEFID